MYERVQLLMMSHHMTKAELAKAIGASTGNISDWTSGKTKPGIEKMIRIADYFNVSLDYLVGRDDRFPSPSPDSWELIRIYEALDREGKAVVLGEAYKQKQRMGSE